MAGMEIKTGVKNSRVRGENSKFGVRIKWTD